MKTIFPFFLSIFILTSCLSKAIIVKNQYYPNGKVKLASEMVKNKPHGTTKEYNETGTLLYEYNFENGVLNGITKQYYFDNEDLPNVNYAEIVFVNGVRTSYEAFYKSGKLFEKGNYLNDELHGKMTQYYETVEKWVECMYDNGKSKEQLIFFKTGELLQKGETINGEYNGEVTQYYKDGTTEIIFNYKDNEHNGLAIKYLDEDTYQICEYQIGNLLYCRIFDNATDKLLEYVPFDNFLRHGIGYEYYSTGFDTLRTVYFDSDTVIKTISFYENKQAERIIPFVNNIPYGIVIEYHENGNIRMELNIVKDVQQGITKSYFETGELEWEENYLDGDKKRDIQTIL
jgi:antitoxin component YwqK of YwqJK toxin-antitoxin module